MLNQLWNYVDDKGHDLVNILEQYFDQTLCHKVFSDIVRSVYPGIYHFIFWRNVFPK